MLTVRAVALGTWVPLWAVPAVSRPPTALCGANTLVRTFTVSDVKLSKARGLRKKKELSEKKLVMFALRIPEPSVIHCVRPFALYINCNDHHLSAPTQTRCFVDQRRVRAVGGFGGDGVCTFHSEPRKQFGGPDGGNGGDGGHVILRAARQVKSLTAIVPVYHGDDGESGGNKNCYGRNANNTYILVPIGTVVKEDEKVVADLSAHGEVHVAAYGGSGGKGNRFFLSNENRAPMTATQGDPGQEHILYLELRTMAHAGMVGFPNAGKSSLLRAISRARPAVADYPFTTLNPHVGVIHYQDFEQVAVADIPGIIRGAHRNRGLGVSFLKHIERCRFLLFVLDLSVAEPWQQLEDLRYELEQYEKGLSERPCCIIGNKIDLPESRANLLALQQKASQRVIPLSALTGANIEELVLHLRELYDGYLESSYIQGHKPLKW